MSNRANRFWQEGLVMELDRRKVVYVSPTRTGRAIRFLRLWLDGALKHLAWRVLP